MTWESRRVCRLRASSSGSARRSIASDTGRPVLFGDFLGTMTESDFSPPCISGFGSLAFPIRTSRLGARSRLGWGDD
jgi:hypothetical protein